MKTETIANGTRVQITGRGRWWTVVDSKMSRSGKTRMYCLRGYDIAVEWLSKQEREEANATGILPPPVEVLTTFWVCEWQISEVAATEPASGSEMR